MVEKPGYSIGNIYQGGYSALNPPENKYMSDGLNAAMSTGSFGMTTDPRTANVLKEVSDKLSMGVKNIEIEGVIEKTFDAIPKEQFKEINRLSKLTGIDVSLHGPVIDVAGFTRQGFNEAEREDAERKVLQTLIRAKDLRPDGNIPVNFHTSEGIPGSQLLPPGEREKAGTEYKRLLVVNRDSGQMAPLEEEKLHFPDMNELKPGVDERIKSGKLSEKEILKNKRKYQIEIPLDKGKILTPEKRIENLNGTEWENKISQLFFNKERADEILEKNMSLIQNLSNKEKFEHMPIEVQREAWSKAKSVELYLDDVHKQAKNIFSKAYEFGDDRQKNELKKLNEEFKKRLENSDVVGQSKAFDFLLKKLNEPVFTPKMWVPLEKFATEKTAKTYGNATFEAYKKFKGKNVPILTIENPPATHALATGEDVANVVKGSRKVFVENAVKEGMSKRQAEKEAEKLIGATWDVGHINMLRKYGYTEKDIIKEAEHVAPLIKHVHLSDNFGFEHTELPMGMGNVPLKEIMEKLGKKGFEATKVIEAADWWQHFQTPPFQETIEAIGSPIYGIKRAPYWNQAINLQESYFGGYGQMLPDTNYQLFGAGFSQLPSELGGSAQGAQGGRMSGKPMQ